MHQALYRKYRSQTFDEVVGQSGVTRSKIRVCSAPEPSAICFACPLAAKNGSVTISSRFASMVFSADTAPVPDTILVLQ